jgi:hypothetical protein
MKRRDFIKTSVAASTLVGLSYQETETQAATAENLSRMQEYYELRMYHLKSGANRELLDSYLSKALIPSLNRLGSKPVGVFVQQQRTAKPGQTEVVDPDTVLVLIPYPTVEAFAAAGGRLNSEQQYQSAGATYLQTPKDQPAFARIESWLLLAFAGMPRIELLSYCKPGQARMFELRTYESYSEVKALKKVAMFNSGEIQLMRDVGLGPIFYGQALIGNNLPHLTYMLSAPDQAAHDRHWDAFRKHPTWDKMKNDPQYADTVSKIYNRFLVPTEYSQV